MSKNDLIAELNDEYRSLLEQIQHFGKDDFEQPGAAGTWSAKDVFAHLAFWNGQASKAIALALRGERPAPWLANDVEAINARESAARQSMSLYKVMDEFRVSLKEVVNQVEAAPDHQLERETSYRAADGSIANAAWVATSLIEHLRLHGEGLDIWLNSQD